MLALTGAGNAGSIVPAGGGLPAGAAYIFDADTDTYSNTALTVPQVTDTGSVQGWKDQSGNARHVTTQAGGGAPILRTNQINGHSCIRSAGVQENLSAAFVLAQPVTLFMVLKQIAWTAGRYIADGRGGDTMDVAQLGSTPAVLMFAGSSACSNTGFTLGSYKIGCWKFNGASSHSRVNDAAAVTGNPGAATTGGITLFHCGVNFGDVNSANCDIAYVIAYPSALNTTDETTVRDWLNARFLIY